MDDQEKYVIKQIEGALMGVQWNSDDHEHTLFFFPTSFPGTRGALRAGDNHVVFKIPLEYEVFLKNDSAYMKFIDVKKCEVSEYRIVSVSKQSRTLSFVDESGNESNFKYI